MELLGDYSKAINLLFICTSKEDFEKHRSFILSKNCISFVDSFLIKNIFNVQKSNIEDFKKRYKKNFDNHEGEHFLMGFNQEKFNVLSIKEIPNKIHKNNSHISSINKKIINFGETPFNQFCKASLENNNELLHISSLIMQKIEQFYGYNNVVPKKEGRIIGSGVKSSGGFNDNIQPLSEIKDNKGNVNDDGEYSIDQKIEEIEEANFLTCNI